MADKAEPYADPVRPCRHPRTEYDEKDGTLYCLTCQSWVLEHVTVPLTDEDGNDYEAGFTRRLNDGGDHG